MQYIKFFFKIFFSNKTISYITFNELMFKIVEKLGKKHKDFCEYKLVQIFDNENKPTEIFEYSNITLNKLNIKKFINLKEIADNNSLEFLRAENKCGIFKKTSHSKVLKFFGISKFIDNSSEKIKLNFGDFIVLSNELIYVVSKNEYLKLFERIK